MTDMADATGQSTVSPLETADQRLASLWATGLLDSAPEPAFDRITRLVTAALAVPVALMSLVDAERQFFKSAIGLPEPWASRRETKLSHSFCRHVVALEAPLVVEDSRLHPLVADNLAVTELNVIAYLGVPLRDSEGLVLGSLCAIDTQPRRWRPEDIALLQDAALIVEGELAARKAASALIDAEAQWRAVLNAVPQMVWSTLPDGSFDYFNTRWYGFTGVPHGATDGASWVEVVHPEDRDRAWACWQAAVLTGTPYEIEFRLHHVTGLYRWVLARGLPIRDAAARITRWIGTCTNIDALKQSEEARELISGELNHRIKNIFAVVSALVSLSARDAPAAAPYAATLRRRLMALAAAHDYVRPPGIARLGDTIGAQPLDGLLDSLLSPYRTGASRIVIGPAPVTIGLSAATALALLMHELATNAVKYGALSQPDGSVEVTCDVGAQVRIVWCERGGPAIANAPAQSGFGSSMVLRAATLQLNGKLAYDWASEGLTVTFETEATCLDS